MGEVLDKQIGGDHYVHCDIQPLDYITRNGLTFAEGSVVKYVTRHRHPGGGGREDLLKAIHYLEYMLQFYNGESEFEVANDNATTPDFTDYTEAQDMVEGEVIEPNLLSRLIPKVSTKGKEDI